ncbi:hypothetical protein [Epilithonimonas hispanica]|uniref:Uncharacterized protein n=1 Tax=Epilithonimonas hispanica TaxID=358687 RepID=A0A3D9CL22_9FLAO|nr:hypothetical protein [Epilithonimonas hispanica]REC66427.1 hypothetical protein DRF58_16600 [Epilithonimonas hispanica]
MVKVLDVTNLSSENSETKILGMYLNAAKKRVDISEIIQYAPVEIPKLYTNLETNSLVSDYLLSNAFQAYILCNDNLQTFVKKTKEDFKKSTEETKKSANEEIDKAKKSLNNLLGK